MTLILSLISGVEAIQLSDRRRINGMGDFEDDLNKAFVLECEDARMVVGFAGLASAPGFHTYEWIHEALHSSFKESACFIRPTLGLFTEKVTQRFQRLAATVDARERHLSIVFTGYIYDEKPPRGYVFLISNFDSLTEREASILADATFTLSWAREKRPHQGRENFGLVMPTGAHGAISDAQLHKLSRLVGNSRRRKLIREIPKVFKKAGRSDESHGLISENYSSVFLPLNPEGIVQVFYHSPDVTRLIHLPGKLVATKSRGIYSVSSIESTPNGILRY